MEKRNKYIVIGLLIIIVLPLSYIAITGYLHNLEEQTFYNTIKNVSDMENNTDADGNVIRNKTTPTVEEIKEYNIESINVTSSEILLLQDLKNKVSNETYEEYINIQINRLNSENRTYTSMLEIDEIYMKYKNGEIGASNALDLIKSKNKDSSSYANKTREYKIEADSFLSIHQDMKEKFDQLGIDEDFLYNQAEEVKITYVK